jgi:hypothetical protein
MLKRKLAKLPKAKPVARKGAVARKRAAAPKAVASKRAKPATTLGFVVEVGRLKDGTIALAIVPNDKDVEAAVVQLSKEQAATIGKNLLDAAGAKR